ncbi:MAG: TlpA family protein disulfide reductase [Vicinamibacterales bacterium]
MPDTPARRSPALVVALVAIAAIAVGLALSFLVTPEPRHVAADDAGPGNAGLPSPGPQPGDPIDLSLALRDLDGSPVPLERYRGKVIVLNFWATWCAPCRGEIPDLVALQADHAGDLVVVGIVVQDQFDTRVASFVREYAMPYPALDGSDAAVVEQAFGGFYGLPTTIVIGRDGIVRERHLGAMTREQMDAAVRDLI